MGIRQRILWPLPEGAESPGVTPAVNPELGALSHKHPAPEFWMPSLSSWTCPLFKWNQDVETQSTQQTQVELICSTCMCQERNKEPLTLQQGPQDISIEP